MTTTVPSGGTTAEHARLVQATDRAVKDLSSRILGMSGDRTSRSAPGALYERTTATMAMPGASFPMIMRCAWRWLCEPVKVQTLVGVIPALPALTIPAQRTEHIQHLGKRFARRMEAQNRQILDWRIRGTGDNRHALLSIVSPDQLVRILATPAWKDNLLF